MRIVFAAGGTGGHFIPAMSVAREIKKAHPEVHMLFMGTGKRFEVDSCVKEGIELMVIPSGPVRRGSVTANMKLPLEVFLGVVHSLRRLILMKPDVLVSMGGYPSVPPFLSAVLLRIPRFVHEQNAIPGLASRIESYACDHVFLSYESSRDFMKKTARITVTGNPATPSRESVAAGRTKKDGDERCLLIMGGSQGAHMINDVVTKYLLETGGLPWQEVYFQTGYGEHESVKEKLSGLGERITVEPFFHNMEEIYSRADIAVSRAGATTIAEIAGWGIPAVLVPYPYAAGGHQEKNAKMMEETGAAILVEQSLFNHRRLARILEELLLDPGKRRKISAAASAIARHDAAKDIALMILNLASTRRSKE
jgi:UDP-N-acetylglucosamine--N-acetylmuramyl-(pentapeptide) pyrophosphoryl-undecaprenol N-acetylglucosamine transferase